MSSVPNETRIQVNGVSLTVFEWPGEGRPVLFAHATGFHARCWDEIVRRLPGRRCIAIDLRGHGRSDKPEGEYNWRLFGEDIAAVGREMDLGGAIGVGHSMGGHSVALAAALETDFFDGLLLLDPVIMPRSVYADTTPKEEHFAARRRNAWESPEAMFERFRDRPPYSLWHEAILRDYCEHGLLPSPDGEGYVLACPPAIEAMLYGMGAGGDIYDDINTIDIPVRIVRARPRVEGGKVDMSASPANPDLASHFANAVDVPRYELSHFIPMQDPGLVVDEIARLEESVARGSEG